MLCQICIYKRKHQESRSHLEFSLSSSIELLHQKFGVIQIESTATLQKKNYNNNFSQIVVNLCISLHVEENFNSVQTRPVRGFKGWRGPWDPRECDPGLLGKPAGSDCTELFIGYTLYRWKPCQGRQGNHRTSCPHGWPQTLTVAQQTLNYSTWNQALKKKLGICMRFNITDTGAVNVSSEHGFSLLRTQTPHRHARINYAQKKLHETMTPKDKKSQKCHP